MQSMWKSQNKTTNLQEYPFIANLLLLPQKTKIWCLAICAVAKWCTTYQKRVYIYVTSLELYLVICTLHKLHFLWRISKNAESTKPLETAKCNFLIIRHFFCQSIARAACQGSWNQNWFIQKKMITTGTMRGKSLQISWFQSLWLLDIYLFVFPWFLPPVCEWTESSDKENSK